MLKAPASAAVASRVDGRLANQLRPLHFRNDIAPYATGSTLVEWGNTRVICGVTVEESVPRWMKEQNVTGGWITAEYSMLPYSTLQRKQRDISKGKIDGRSQEIQRLIGRAMRAAIDLDKLGQRTIWVDCDVLQADGGTRCASITGACVALHDAVAWCKAQGLLAEETPALRDFVAAVSVGIVEGIPMLDLDYAEDSGCDTDMNVVMTGAGGFVEIQGTAEGATFSRLEMDMLIVLAERGIGELIGAQKTALEMI
jgi:ribonuclease PH